MPYSKVPGHRAPWEAIDASGLRQFLDTVSGQRFIAQIFLRRPVATEKSDAIKRSIQSGVQEGYEEFYRTVRHLCTPESLVATPVEKAAKTSDKKP